MKSVSLEGRTMLAEDMNRGDELALKQHRRPDDPSFTAYDFV